MAITEARYKANKKYDAKAYDRVSVVLYKGEKNSIRDYVTEEGFTFNGFIREAIIEKLQRMGAPEDTLKKW